MILRFTLLTIFLYSAIYSQTQIAVVEFQGKGVSTIEASALTDRLVLELFKTGQFTVLEREMLDKILEEQKFQLSGCTSTECLIEIGRLANVQEIVSGSVSKVGSYFSISAKLISVESGKILKVAVYDYSGQLGELLVTGMKDIAYQLTGDFTIDQAPNYDNPPSDNPVDSQKIDENGIDVFSSTNDTTVLDSKIKSFIPTLPSKTPSAKEYSYLIEGEFGFRMPDSPAPYFGKVTVASFLGKNLAIGLGFTFTESQFFPLQTDTVSQGFQYLAPDISLTYFPLENLSLRGTILWPLDGGFEDNENPQFFTDSDVRSLGWALDFGYSLLLENTRFNVTPHIKLLNLVHSTYGQIWVGVRLGYS